jgi:hypothetical protein
MNSNNLSVFCAEIQRMRRWSKVLSLSSTRSDSEPAAAATAAATTTTSQEGDVPTAVAADSETAAVGLHRPFAERAWAKFVERCKLKPIPLAAEDAVHTVPAK